MPHDAGSGAAWPETPPWSRELPVSALLGEDPRRRDWREAFAASEPERGSQTPESCPSCLAPDDTCVWVSDRWRVRPAERPGGLPIAVVLECRSHLDLGDLPNLLAAELGVMIVRLERAIRSVDGVARVHVNRWGECSAHAQVWFLARPVGHPHLRDSSLPLWNDLLPAQHESIWRANLAAVAAWLAEFGGKPMVAPPPFDWSTPAYSDG